MSDTAHGILALRASARLLPRSRLPAREPGDAAERERSARRVLRGQRWRWLFGERGVVVVCRGEPGGEVDGDGCGPEGLACGFGLEGAEAVLGGWLISEVEKA